LDLSSISPAKRMAASPAENLCCCACIKTEQRMAFQSSVSARLRLSTSHPMTYQAQQTSKANIPWVLDRFLCVTYDATPN
jgi:hypothetical protein